MLKFPLALIVLLTISQTAQSRECCDSRLYRNGTCEQGTFLLSCTKYVVSKVFHKEDDYRVEADGRLNMITGDHTVQEDR